MKTLRNGIAASAAALALMLTIPAGASPGIHTTLGSATGMSGTLTVNATEPGSGTVVVNNVTYTVVCMQVSSFTPTPGGAHDVFIKAVVPGTTGAVFVRILDMPIGPDSFGFNFTGLTYGIACDADQNVTPVTSGAYLTLP